MRRSRCLLAIGGAGGAWGLVLGWTAAVDRGLTVVRSVLVVGRGWAIGGGMAVGLSGTGALGSALTSGGSVLVISLTLALGGAAIPALDGAAIAISGDASRTRADAVARG